MKKFMDDDFLLSNRAAVRLYHDYAEGMPVFDYHCHLPVQDIAENKKFSNLTEIWLNGDHYKWRAMRANGVDERYITGDASDAEKFYAWGKTVPFTIGNPLYHWSHLELRRYFGITELLTGETAENIFKTASALLGNEDFRVRSLLEKSNVKVVCTTDDPVDSLEYHKALKADGPSRNGSFKVKVLPAFRPDRALAFENPVELNLYLDKLSGVSGVPVTSFSNFTAAIKTRHDFFNKMGCRISDHALTLPVFAEGSEERVSTLFKRIRSGEVLKEEEVEVLKTASLLAVARMNAAKGWTMQLHFGALRNNNSKMFKKIGADTGFDSISDGSIAAPLSRFLDALERKDELPRTILYNLNPVDNYVVGTMIGNFQGGGIPGKIQFGSGWWFNDQKDGMESQLSALSNLGLLSRFVGMLTDSRSFLSYPRHEYFRRILCNLIGSWVENGEAPEDYKLLGSMVKNISFNNAAKYFGVEL